MKVKWFENINGSELKLSEIVIDKFTKNNERMFLIVTASKAIMEVSACNCELIDEHKKNYPNL